MNAWALMFGDQQGEEQEKKKKKKSITKTSESTHAHAQIDDNVQCMSKLL